MIELLLSSLGIGAMTDAASATGSALARLAELLTNRLSATRAAKLDNLDATISSRLTASVKSVQEIAGAGPTITISSVTVAKSHCETRGYSTTAGSGQPLGLVSGRITAATTVTTLLQWTGSAYLTVVEHF